MPHYAARILATVLLLLAGIGQAAAGILLEASFAGQKVRIEQGQDRERTFATVAGTRHVIDLARGEVYRLDPAPPWRIRAAAIDDGALLPAAVLEQWSEGPLVAGHGSTYNVLIIGERICGEVLASPWMGPYAEGIARSLELLQRVEPKLAPPPRPDCGRLDFALYTARGFPLLAGFKADPVFRVERLRFDHHPDESLFTLPATARDCGAHLC